RGTETAKKERPWSATRRSRRYKGTDWKEATHTQIPPHSLYPTGRDPGSSAKPGRFRRGKKEDPYPCHEPLQQASQSRVFTRRVSLQYDDGQAGISLHKNHSKNN